MASNSGQTSNLVIGCDLMSNKLKYCLSPMGWLFKFEERPSNRPKPMTLTVVAIISTMPLVMILTDYSVRPSLIAMAGDSHEFDLLIRSTFLTRLVKFFAVYRLVYQIATIFIVLARYGSTANVVASTNNMVSEREQRHFANSSFAIFLFKTLANSTSYSIIMAAIHLNLEGFPIYAKVIPIIIVTLINMTIAAPLMYSCYLGSVLGKHVENFSKYYVDTMFDQFMKTIEVVGSPVSSQESNGASESSGLNGDDDEQEGAKNVKHTCWGNCFCCNCFCLVYKPIKRFILLLWHKLKALGHLLNSRKYPELPEMKMTKLSSETNIQITEAKRVANTHLIRIRLRRTQIMLSELRDMVSDINKMLSPILMMQVIYETVLIILIATTSIQARVYKALNLLILPTITSTIGLVVSIVYVCICLDETTSQLKLMINKLFDFIILNHRVQTIEKPEDETEISQMAPPSGSSNGSPGIGIGSTFSSGSRLLASEKEKEALSETWSQFQYTRKLANTIQFTMGGILPVSRRLVLSIFGHVLSAVFISIEIMSIIDTSHEGHSGSGGVGHKPMASNDANFTSMLSSG